MLDKNDMQEKKETKKTKKTKQEKKTKGEMNEIALKNAFARIRDRNATGDVPLNTDSTVLDLKQSSIPTTLLPEEVDSKKEEIEINEKTFNEILNEIFDEYKEERKGKKFDYFRDLLNDFDDNFFKKEKFEGLKE